MRLWLMTHFPVAGPTVQRQTEVPVTLGSPAKLNDGCLAAALAESNRTNRVRD